MHSDALKEILLPLETSLRDIAEIAVSEADADKLRKGQGVSPRAYKVQNLIGQEAAAFYDEKFGCDCSNRGEKNFPASGF